MPKFYFYFGETKIDKIDICCGTFESLIRMSKWIIHDRNFRYLSSERDAGDGDGKARELHLLAEGKESLTKNLKFCYGCAERIEFILIGKLPAAGQQYK